MAVGDVEDDSSSCIRPLPYHSSSVSDPRVSPSAMKLPLQLPLSNQAANVSQYYSLNQYLPSLPRQQQQPKQSASTALPPELSATSASASSHSLPATGVHPELKDEATGGSSELEGEATGGRDESEDVADGAVGATASYEAKKLLTSKPALEVIEMGFPSEVVETVIHLKVVETGEDYLTAEALLDAVMAYQLAMSDDESERDEASNSNSRNSPRHQDRQLENVCEQNLSAGDTTQQGERVRQKKKKGKVKSPRSVPTTATGNQQQTNNKSSDLRTDGENTEENSSASASSQMPLPFVLKEENRKMKSSRLCKICVENEIRIVFLPCGHLVCCEECSSLVQKCTVCHRAVKGSIKVFLA